MSVSRAIARDGSNVGQVSEKGTILMHRFLLNRLRFISARTSWKLGVLAVSITVAAALLSHSPVQASAAQAIAYKFVAVNFPGAASTEVHGINERGDLVGRYNNLGQSDNGFIKTEDGFTSISLSADGTDFYGINQRREIVGIRFDFAEPPFGRGFLYRNGQLTNIHFPGSNDTLPYAINDRGEIVGSYDVGPNFISNGFIRNESGYKALDVPGVVYSYATGVSNTGAIVGIAVFNPTGNPCCSGYLYEDGVFRRIDFPAAGTNATYAYGVNRRGTVTGWYADQAFNAHGYVDVEGEFTTVDYPGSTSTQIQSINDRGELVGFYSGGDCTGQPGFSCGFVAILASSDDAGGKQDR